MLYSHKDFPVMLVSSATAHDETGETHGRLYPAFLVVLGIFRAENL